ncbi:MAG: metalloregulator ArsR/SmtB family transcription factor [Erysipelotrichaceae bacterium]|nr:metalloregulator ArsR/SmtB family transcription factor [Erysipelotrichaceae bacterium]MDY5252049.1 metalloregulator ArsR/SmtB family transcription factor [Erysipelotrichaceae bacterium]
MSNYLTNNECGEEAYEDMSLLFSMFADRTRLKIINVLAKNEMCVRDIATKLQMSQSAISHQLSSLKKVKLIRSRKEGKMVFYSLADDHVSTIFMMAYDHICEKE